MNYENAAVQIHVRSIDCDQLDFAIRFLEALKEQAPSELPPELQAFADKLDCEACE